MENLFSNYTIIARFFPAIISALPLLVLWFFLSEIEDLQSLVSYLTKLRFYGAISISLVFLYFFAQLIRITSKYFQNKYFIKKDGFPTTYLMLYKNPKISDQTKNNYREKIRHYFEFELLDRKSEQDDIGEARKRLDEATELVINKVKKGSLVEKHNIWYGFFRNICGGAIFAIIFSSLNFVTGIIFNYRQLSIYSVVFLILYGSVLVFNKQILTQCAEEYAKKLIFEFIGEKD